MNSKTMNPLLRRAIALLLAFVMVFTGPVVPGVSALTDSSVTAAEADGWYWEGSTLYIKDGSITKGNLYSALTDANGYTKMTAKGKTSVYGKYSAELRYAEFTASTSTDTGWEAYGNKISSGDSALADPSLSHEGTYKVAATTGNSYSIRGISKWNNVKEFTVKHYYVVDTAVAAGSPNGAGISVATKNVVKGSSTAITVKPVDGFEVVVKDDDDNTITNLSAYSPTKSTTLTAYYESAAIPTHIVSTNVVNEGLGIVQLSRSGDVPEGESITLTVTPNSNGYISEITINGAEMSLSDFNSSRGKTGTFTVGKNDITVNVTFKEKKIDAVTSAFVDYNPKKTINAQLDKLQKEIFNKVVNAESSLPAGLTWDMLTYEYLAKNENTLGAKVDEVWSPLDEVPENDKGTTGYGNYAYYAFADKGVGDVETVRLTWAGDRQLPTISVETEITLTDGRLPQEAIIDFETSKNNPYVFYSLDELNQFLLENAKVSVGGGTIISATSKENTFEADVPKPISATVSIEETEEYLKTDYVVEGIWVQIAEPPATVNIEVVGEGTVSVGTLQADGTLPAGAYDLVATPTNEKGYVASVLVDGVEKGNVYRKYSNRVFTDSITLESDKSHTVKVVFATSSITKNNPIGTVGMNGYYGDSEQVEFLENNILAAVVQSAEGVSDSITIEAYDSGWISGWFELDGWELNFNIGSETVRISWAADNRYPAMSIETDITVVESRTKATFPTIDFGVIEFDTHDQIDSAVTAKAQAVDSRISKVTIAGEEPKLDKDGIDQTATYTLTIPASADVLETTKNVDVKVKGIVHPANISVTEDSTKSTTAIDDVVDGKYTVAPGEGSASLPITVTPVAEMYEQGWYIDTITVALNDGTPTAVDGSFVGNGVFEGTFNVENEDVDKDGNLIEKKYVINVTYAQRTLVFNEGVEVNYNLLDDKEAAVLNRAKDAIFDTACGPDFDKEDVTVTLAEGESLALGEVKLDVVWKATDQRPEMKGSTTVTLTANPSKLDIQYKDVSAVTVNGNFDRVIEAAQKAVAYAGGTPDEANAPVYKIAEGSTVPVQGEEKTIYVDVTVEGNDYYAAASVSIPVVVTGKVHPANITMNSNAGGDIVVMDTASNGVTFTDGKATYFVNPAKNDETLTVYAYPTIEGYYVKDILLNGTSINPTVNTAGNAYECMASFTVDDGMGLAFDAELESYAIEVVFAEKNVEVKDGQSVGYNPFTGVTYADNTAIAFNGIWNSVVDKTASTDEVNGVSLEDGAKVYYKTGLDLKQIEADGRTAALAWDLIKAGTSESNYEQWISIESDRQYVKIDNSEYPLKLWGSAGVGSTEQIKVEWAGDSRYPTAYDTTTVTLVDSRGEQTATYGTDKTGAVEENAFIYAGDINVEAILNYVSENLTETALNGATGELGVVTVDNVSMSAEEQQKISDMAPKSTIAVKVNVTIPATKDFKEGSAEISVYVYKPLPNAIYTATVSAGGSAVLTEANGTAFESGTSVINNDYTLTVTPDDGYYVDSVSVNGTALNVKENSGKYNADTRAFIDTIKVNNEENASYEVVVNFAEKKLAVNNNEEIFFNPLDVNAANINAEIYEDVVDVAASAPTAAGHEHQLTAEKVAITYEAAIDMDAYDALSMLDKGKIQLAVGLSSVSDYRIQVAIGAETANIGGVDVKVVPFGSNATEKITLTWAGNAKYPIAKEIVSVTLVDPRVEQSAVIGVGQTAETAVNITDYPNYKQHIIDNITVVSEDGKETGAIDVANFSIELPEMEYDVPAQATVRFTIGETVDCKAATVTQKVWMVTPEPPATINVNVDGNKGGKVIISSEVIDYTPVEGTSFTASALAGEYVVTVQPNSKYFVESVEIDGVTLDVSEESGKYIADSRSFKDALQIKNNTTYNINVKFTERAINVKSDLGTVDYNRYYEVSEATAETGDNQIELIKEEILDAALESVTPDYTGDKSDIKVQVYFPGLKVMGYTLAEGYYDVDGKFSYIIDEIYYVDEAITKSASTVKAKLILPGTDRYPERTVEGIELKLADTRIKAELNNAEYEYATVDTDTVENFAITSYENDKAGNPGGLKASEMTFALDESTPLPTTVGETATVQYNVNVPESSKYLPASAKVYVDVTVMDRRCNIEAAADVEGTITVNGAQLTEKRAVDEGTVTVVVTPPAKKAVKSVTVTAVSNVIESETLADNTIATTPLVYTYEVENPVGEATTTFVADGSQGGMDYTVDVEYEDALFVFEDPIEMDYQYGIDDAPTGELVYEEIVQFPENTSEEYDASLTYLARPAGQYYVEIPAISAFGITFYEGGQYEIDAEDLWLEPGAPIEEVDIDKELDILLEQFEDFEFSITKLGELWDYVNEFFDRIDNMHIGAHYFGQYGDGSTEKVRLTYNDGKYIIGETEETLTIVDNRIKTVIAGSDVEVTYGFTEAELREAINMSLTDKEGNILVDDSEIFFKKDVNGLDAGEYDLEVYYDGDKDNQPAQATFHVVVNKAPSSINYDSQIVTYGDEYEFKLDKDPENIDTLNIMIGLDVSQTETDDFLPATEITLQMPESMELIYNAITKMFGNEISLGQIEEVFDAVEGLLDLAGINSESIQTILNTINSVTEGMDTDKVKIKFVNHEAEFHPENIGVYLAGAVTTDANYETSYTIDYLVVIPKTTEADLEYRFQDSNGIITKGLIEEGLYDLGADAYVNGEYSDVATEGVGHLFLKVDLDGNVKVIYAKDNEDIKNYVDSGDLTQIGAYGQLSFVLDIANEMFYSKPIVRAYAVISELVDVQFVDESGSEIDTYKTTFDGTNENRTPLVNVKDKNGDPVDQALIDEHLKLQYYGYSLNNPNEIYKGEEPPTDAGAYTCIAIYGDEENEVFGADICAYLVEPAKASVNVPEQTVFAGDDYDLGITSTPDDAKRVDIVAGIDASGEISLEKIDPLSGVINIDFPARMDKVLKQAMPSAYEGDGISANEILTQLDLAEERLAELGFGEIARNAIISVLEMIPETELGNAKVTFNDNVVPQNIGMYLVGSTICDPNYKPAVDLGYLLVQPKTTEAELEFIYEDDNHIFTKNYIESGDIDMGSRVKVTDKVDAETAAYLTENELHDIFLGVDGEGNFVVESSPIVEYGAYTQISFLLDDGNEIYYAKPIQRVYVIVPETCEVDIVDAEGTEKDAFKETFDGTEKGLEFKVTHNDGTVLVDTLAGVDSDKLSVRYFGYSLNNPDELYLSETAPVDAGLYTAVAIYADKEGDIFGVDVAALAIEPADASVDVKNQSVKHGSEYDLGITVEPEDCKYISIVAGVTTNGQILDEDLTVGVAPINVNFPNRLDKVLKEIVPEAYTTGITVGNLTDKLENIKTKLEGLGIGGEITDAITNAINSVIEMVPSTGIKVTFKDDVVPTDMGVYLVGAVTCDPNYKPSADVGFLVVQPGTIEAELAFNYEVEDLMITASRIKDGSIDLGSHVVPTDDVDKEQAVWLTENRLHNLYVSVNVDGGFDISTSPSAAYGAYSQLAFLLDDGEEIYYATPISRAYMVVPETVSVEFIDKAGNVDKQQEVKYNGQPQAMDVRVTAPDGTVLPNDEHLTVRYIGADAKGIQFYNSEVPPTNVGAYAVIATYYDKEKDYFGIAAGTLVIEPGAATIDVIEGTYEYSEDYRFQVETDPAGIEKMVATINLGGGDTIEGEVGMINVDFPSRIDKVLKTLLPDIYANGVNMKEFMDFVDEIKGIFTDLGIDASIVDKLVDALNDALAQFGVDTSNADITFKDLADIHPVPVGTYAVAGVTLDINYEIGVMNIGMVNIIEPKIEQEEIILKIDDASKNFGEEDPEFTYTFEGVDEETFEKVVGEFQVERVTGEDAGTYDIYAFPMINEEFVKYYKVTVENGTFTINPASLRDATVTATDKIYTGEAIEQAAGEVTVEVGGIFGMGTTTLVEGEDFKIVGYENNVNVGTATVTIEGIGNYAGSTANGTFQINPKEITTNHVDPKEIETQREGVTPAVTVTVDDIVLEEGTDYEVTYVNNDKVGTATLTVKGINNYAGEVERHFNIIPAEIKVQLEETTFVYDGSEKKPAVQSLNGLIEGTDYTVTYENNVNAGTAKAIVTGIGNYEGDDPITLEFTITKAPLTAYVEDKTVVYGDTVEYGKDDVSFKTANDNEFTQKDLIFGFDMLTFTYNEAEMSNVGTYDVTVTNAEEVLTADNYEIVGIEEGKLTVNAKEIRGFKISEIADQTYTGSAITPEVTVEGLTAEDFEVQYDNNINAGTATVTITAMGNYTGTLTTTFNINKAQLTVTVADATRVYGQENPAFEVIYDGFVGEDSVSDLNKKAEAACAATVTSPVGEYIIVASGAEADNYTIKYVDGKLTVTSEEISNMKANGIADQTYTGSAITPEVEIEGLVEGTDYVVKGYENNVNVGTATVIIEGQGNYSGEMTVEFNIVQADNEWTKELSMSKKTWTYGEPAGTPSAAAKFGTVSYEFFKDGESLGTTVPENAGTYTVKATVAETDNYKGLTAEVEFTIKKAANKVSTVSITGWTYGDAPVAPTATATYGTPTFKYFDANGDEVSGVPVNAGKYTVKAYVAESENYEAGESAARPFAIAKRNLDDEKMTVGSIADQVFTGSEVEPGVTVLDGYRGVELTEADYTITYANNVNIGKATATVTGQGNYTGKVKRNFNIKYEQDGLFAEVDPAVFTYNGQVQTPVVKADGLTEGKDYTVTYPEGCKNVGTYEITVTGIGKFAGIVETVEFSIVKAAATVEVVDQTVVYGDEYVSEAQVSGLFAEDTLEGDMLFNYFADEACTTAIEKPVDAGTYYVTASGLTSENYTVSYKAGKLVIEVKDAEKLAVEPIVDQTYTGTAIEPEVIVRDGEKVLVEGKDYTVVYGNNIDAGQADVTITFTGNYAGNVETNFNILPAQLPEAELEYTEAVYNGEAKKPKVTIEGLTEGVDFEVVYGENTNAGEGTVTITGKGNYVGTIEKTIEITPAELPEAELEYTEAVYDGNAKEPKVIIEGLTEGVDFAVVYGENINAGEGTVTITGLGNYAGIIEKTIEITPAELPEAELEYTKAVYDGNAKEPKVTIEGLTEGVDFEVVYGENTNAGEGTVTITGLGNYAGTIDMTFEIEKAQNEWTTPVFMANWMEGEEPADPKGAAKYGEVTFKYFDAEGNEVSGVPTAPGEYTMVATVPEGQNYTGLEDEVSFEIYEKEVVIVQKENAWTKELAMDGWKYGEEASKPEAEAKYGVVEFVYYADEACTEEIAKPEKAGTYFVKAFVEETVDYTGLESEAVKFVVDKADNAWTVELTIEDWTNGEAAKAPKAESKYGEVTYAYYEDEACTKAIDIAKAANGTYFVKAIVAEGENYTGLESDPVKFTIHKNIHQIIKELGLEDNITNTADNGATVGYVRGFDYGMDSADLKAQMEAAGNLVAFEENTDVAGYKGDVATGMEVAFDINGVVHYRTIVVMGDVNGDGFIYATDYRKIKNQIMDEGPALKDEFALAADIDDNSKIWATDYRAIKNFIMEGIEIEQGNPWETL